MIAMSSGKWMVLDSNTREIYGLFQDGVESLHTVRFSPDGKFLVLGSRDGILYIYQVSGGYKKYHRMGRCLVSYGYFSSFVFFFSPVTNWNYKLNTIEFEIKLDLFTFSPFHRLKRSFHRS